MKILLATYWPVPHVGGVWTFMLQLKNRLESMGHEVDLLGNGNDKGSTYVHIVNENRRVAKNKFIPLLQAKMNPGVCPELYSNSLVQYAEFQRYYYELAAAYLGLEKYDVIHAQDVIASSCLNRVRPKNTAMVTTLHGCVALEIEHQLHTIHKSPTGYIARAYYKGIEHRGATSAEITTVANEWLKNMEISEYSVPIEKIEVFQYGFDIDQFTKKMKEKSSVSRPNGKKVIIFTGRLVEQKGVHDLISALKLLKQKRKDWVCWIVGEGEKQAELQVQCKTHGLEGSVQFFGKRDDVPYLLSLADIFVLPSLIENQSLSVIEAQLAGKPVIVSNAGGLPEMVRHNETGLIFPVGDVRTLCSHLNTLLENENLAKKLAENAKRWGLNHWNMDMMIGRILNAYRKAIKQRRGESV
jgi:glycosyltransferase involved in cell wall biosynthesis